MSIITFWNDTREQSGKTLASVAVATNMAIERNNRILLISTSFNDSTINRCFWGNEVNKNAKFFKNKNSNIAVENGIEGLIKLIGSNKLTPSIITDYTRVIFKERLEILNGFSTFHNVTLDRLEEFRKLESYYIDLIKTANQYYDIVIVDLDKMLSSHVKEEILQMSNLTVYVFSQKLDSIDRYNELKQSNHLFSGNKCIPVIGKYNDKFKYNSKNILRYLGERKALDIIPLNLAYMEASEEANVVDLFLRIRNIKDKTDENYIFRECIQNLTNNIIKRLQELKMRMR